MNEQMITKMRMINNLELPVIDDVDALISVTVLHRCESHTTKHVFVTLVR